MQKQGGRTNEKGYEEGDSDVAIVCCGSCGYFANDTTAKKQRNNRKSSPIGK